MNRKKIEELHTHTIYNTDNQQFSVFIQCEILKQQQQSIYHKTSNKHTQKRTQNQ